LRRRDRRRDLAGVCHVERDGNGPLAELFDEVLHRLGPSRSYHHAVAVLKRCMGDLSPKAGGASGDQPTGHLRPSLPAGAADMPYDARPAVWPAPEGSLAVDVAPRHLADPA